MIIKYAYAYAEPKGTFYVGYREGVVTHSISATAMSLIAAQEGGVIAWLRRTIVSQIGIDELFELVNVTPKKILERGIISGEEIKELYDLVKFDPELDKAMKSYAQQVHEVLEAAGPSNADRVLAALKNLVKEDLLLDAKLDDADPSIVLVKLKVPPDFIIMKGVQDGSENRP